MTPNVLIVGVGKGSWAVRGVQIGKAIGARVTGAATAADWAWADICILVKRAWETFAQTATDAGVPIIWDAVDFWQQPDENHVDDPVALTRRYMGNLSPTAIICATKAMAVDLGGLYIPHHSRPGLMPAPVRTQLQLVAYEGTPKYLGPWRTALESACARVGAAFVVNPPDLRAADLVVAFRGGPWDGPICRRWKSGVKYVNAQAAGRPVLTQAHAAFEETGVDGRIVDDPDDLESAIRAYLDPAVRQAVFEHAQWRAMSYSLRSIAVEYKTLIGDVMRKAAA